MKPLKVGELARRTGVSIRALHYYDAINLLSPSHRTASGHRRYIETDVARLQKIKSLRQLGFALDQVRELVQSSTLVPLRIIEGHLQRVREQLEVYQLLEQRLGEIAETTRSGGNVHPTSLLKTIEAMTMTEKIYTRTGDDGTTGLAGGMRVKKASIRIEACGAMDELNTALGAARATNLDGDVDALLEAIQIRLFEVGAPVAGAGETNGAHRSLIDAAAGLERAIDRVQAKLPPLKGFVLPGGGIQGAAMHTARTACRRAERAVLALEEVSKAVVLYLNRLGDLLFVLARQANVAAGVPEVFWPTPSRPAIGPERRRPGRRRASRSA